MLGGSTPRHLHAFDPRKPGKIHESSLCKYFSCCIFLKNKRNLFIRHRNIALLHPHPPPRGNRSLSKSFFRKFSQCWSGCLPSCPHSCLFLGGCTSTLLCSKGLRCQWAWDRVWILVVFYKNCILLSGQCMDPGKGHIRPILFHFSQKVTLSHIDLSIWGFPSQGYTNIIIFSIGI